MGELDCIRAVLHKNFLGGIPVPVCFFIDSRTRQRNVTTELIDVSTSWSSSIAITTACQAGHQVWPLGFPISGVLTKFKLAEGP